MLFASFQAHFPTCQRNSTGGLPILSFLPTASHMCRPCRSLANSMFLLNVPHFITQPFPPGTSQVIQRPLDQLVPPIKSALSRINRLSLNSYKINVASRSSLILPPTAWSTKRRGYSHSWEAASLWNSIQEHIHTSSPTSVDSLTTSYQQTNQPSPRYRRFATHQPVNRISPPWRLHWIKEPSAEWLDQAAVLLVEAIRSQGRAAKLVREDIFVATKPSLNGKI